MGLEAMLRLFCHCFLACFLFFLFHLEKLQFPQSSRNPALLSAVGVCHATACPSLVVLRGAGCSWGPRHQSPWDTPCARPDGYCCSGQRLLSFCSIECTENWEAPQQLWWKVEKLLPCTHISGEAGFLSSKKSQSILIVTFCEVSVKLVCSHGNCRSCTKFFVTADEDRLSKQQWSDPSTRWLQISWVPV